MSYEDDDWWDEKWRAAEARVALLEKALEPFANFAKQYKAKPLRGMDDKLYGIHAGSEWEACLRLSDCARALALLSPSLTEDHP